MENATKALLIAGLVLIAILVLVAGLYLYSLFSEQSKEYNETVSQVELQKFNSKFDVYVGRTDITAQEIVSIINIAKEYKNDIKIYIGNAKLEFTSSYTPEDFIKVNKSNSYSCILNTSNSYANPEYDSLGKIVKIKFRKN